MNSLSVRLIVVLMMVSVLSSCSGYVLTLGSYPTLQNTSKKSNRTYGLNELDWIVNFKDVEFSVDVKNYRILKSNTSILLATTSENGVRAPYVNRSPFVIDIGVRAKRSDYLFNIENSAILIDKANGKIKPSAIYVARVGRELDCLLYKEKDLNLPLADSEIRIPTTAIPAKPDSPLHWKCIKYVFDIPTPDPETRFSFTLGNIHTADKREIKDIIIDFDPLRYESRSSN
jgi:hypothetical protein